MNKVPYPKHFLSFTDQIALLKQRGLIFIQTLFTVSSFLSALKKK